MLRATQFGRWIAPAALSLVCASAHALVAHVDEFRIVRDGTTFFLDSFSDDIEPPVVPGAFNCGAASPSCYAVAGFFNSTDESGGKLRMSTAQGDQTESAIGNPRVIQGATLLSNRSDLAADIDAGLKQHRVFTASVTFDLTIPGPAEVMQLRLLDTHANAADPGHRTDFLSLGVRLPATAGAVPEIRFFEQNFATDSLTEIDTKPLDLTLGANQIRLILSHPMANSTEIFASWEYLSAGAVVLADSFPTAGNIFDGETWTRANFALTAPIPEPASYALMLAGAGIVAWRLRRRKA